MSSTIPNHSASNLTDGLIVALNDVALALSLSVDVEIVAERFLVNVGRVIACDMAILVRLDQIVPQIYVKHFNSDQLFEDYTFMTLDEFPLGIQAKSTLQPIMVDDFQTDEPGHSRLGKFKSSKSQPLRAGICIPIRIENEVLGMLMVGSLRSKAFLASHIPQLSAFAPLAAIAIRNSQLYDTVVKQVDELTALYRATSFLFIADTVQEIATYIASAVVDEFHQTDCGVITLDDESGELIRVARAGGYQVKAQQPLFLDGQGLVPESVRQNQLIYAPDVTKNPYYIANEPRTRSELVVPLIAHARTIGVLDLQSESINAFSERDQRIIQAFADHGAAAIENARLIENVRLYMEELEERVIQRTNELKHTKEYFETIFENSSDCILVLRLDGIILQTNAAFKQLFGDIVGKPLTVLMDAKSRLRMETAFKNLLTDGFAERVEVSIALRFKQVFVLDASIFGIKSLDGSIGSVVCSLRDITNRKQLETDLKNTLKRERELTELRSRFITTVSHSFRTPLTRVLTSSSLLKTYRHKMKEVQIEDKLVKIELAVQDMTRLLDATVELNETPQAYFTPVFLNPLFQQVIADIQRDLKPQQTFIFVQEGVVLPVNVDADLINKALVEILTNAVKFSSAESVITCKLEYLSERVVVSIEDVGIGIPESDIPLIFEVFHRAPNAQNLAGAGLGLTVVKQIIETHRGTIEVKSHLDKGTCMSITLPIY